MNGERPRADDQDSAVARGALRRRFNTSERAALYLAADGHCADCGAELAPSWHSDHVTPYARGGATDVANGQALCPPCNLKKGARMTDDLRDWQREAIRKFEIKNARDFLVSATPGAGKTRFALTLAERLRTRGDVTRIVVIVPTDALRTQWSDEAAQFGLHLMPVSAPEDYDKSGYHGCVVTYAQLAVGAGADLLRRCVGREPTLALLDEVHHLGDDRRWGDGTSYAIERAVRRVGLTGTPWRKDKRSPIPFVTYDDGGEVIVDHGYEYGEAVADGVCRRIEFHAYDGEARWIDSGKEVTATLGNDMADDDVSAALDTILSPDREWMPGILAAANRDLVELRREVPDAGGLVIADNQWQARKYAAKLSDMTGEMVAVAVSDDPNAAGVIEEFRRGRTAWLVAVKMVSEGVDIRRLAVGVYATKSRTPLFFRQVVGRFVRTRPEEELNARLYIPAVPAYLDHARAIEEELRHQLEIAIEREAKEPGDGSERIDSDRQPLSASAPEFSASIYAGSEVPAELHERAVARARELGIPVMWAVNLIPTLFSEPVATVTVEPKPVVVQSRARLERQLRADVESLARRLAYRERIEVREVNTALIKAGFPKRAKCSIDDLEKVRAYLFSWWAEV